MIIHMRHGATKNSAQWLNMGNENKLWYEKHGQYRSLCWTKKSSIKTDDDIKNVSCKKCLAQFN